MKKRNIIALSLLLTLLLFLAFLQTPLMEQFRIRAWEGTVALAGRMFGFNDGDGNETVTKELASLRAENIRLQAELQDYRRLRAQLGSPSFADLRPIPAVVVSRPIDAFHSEFIINKGIRQGISVNSPVVVQGSVLVGFIKEVTEQTATIQLLLHPAAQLTAETVPADEETPIARGLLRSRYYTSLHLTTVPRDVPLTVNQRLVTASKDNVPYGLVVGTIAEVSSPEHEAYQEARIALPYDPDSLDVVSVLAAP